MRLFVYATQVIYSYNQFKYVIAESKRKTGAAQCDDAFLFNIIEMWYKLAHFAMTYSV